MEKLMKKLKRIFFFDIIIPTVCFSVMLYSFIRLQTLTGHAIRFVCAIFVIIVFILFNKSADNPLSLSKRIINISSLLSPYVLFSIIACITLILCAYASDFPIKEPLQCIIAVIHYMFEIANIGLCSWMFCESLEKLFCDSDIGFVVCVVLKAIYTSVFVVIALVVEYTASLSAVNVIFIMIMELWLAQASEYPPKIIVDGQERQISIICRMLLYFPVLYSVLFYKTDHLVISFPGYVWPVFIAIMALSIVYNFRPYRVYMAFAYQNDRLRSKYNHNLFILKPLMFSEKNEYKRGIMVDWDVIVSIIVSISVVIGYRYAVDHMEMDVVTIPFIRSFGAEILGALLSVTFLLTSFLSFFSSRDDKCLWTDTIDYKLVSPKLRNFRSLAVYAFTALLVDGICFFMEYDILVAVFFGIDVLMLIVLTFSMIDIYFHRNGIIENLENEFFMDDPPEQERKLMDLHCNTQTFLMEKDYKRITENSIFLVKSHLFYKEISYFLGYYLHPVIFGSQDDYTRKLSWDMKRYYSDYPWISRMIYIDQSQASVSADKTNEFMESIKVMNDDVLHYLKDICELIKDQDRNIFITMLSKKSAQIIEAPPIRSIVFESIKNEMAQENTYPYLAKHVLKDIVERYITDCNKQLKATEKFGRRNLWLNIIRQIRLKDQKEVLESIKEKLDEIAGGIGDSGEYFILLTIQDLKSKLERAITEHKEAITLPEAYFTFVKQLASDDIRIFRMKDDLIGREK